MISITSSELDNKCKYKLKLVFRSTLNRKLYIYRTFQLHLYTCQLIFCAKYHISYGMFLQVTSAYFSSIFDLKTSFTLRI